VIVAADADGAKAIVIVNTSETAASHVVVCFAGRLDLT